ncbi:MAG: hypothetical protein JW765_07655 [Deltaproteobacteria bacterium]|nr:hypothetical protein [Candidatus Zymogenaceae bacterium]
MKIRVKTYSGHKADERPTSFFLGNRELAVVELVDRYYDPHEDIFKVKAEDGGVYIIGHDRQDDGWRLKGYYRP